MVRGLRVQGKPGSSQKPMETNKQTNKQTSSNTTEKGKGTDWDIAGKNSDPALYTTVSLMGMMFAVSEYTFLLEDCSTQN